MVSLTPRQLDAVTHPGGPLLVLGGAGTGKTTVLCERFAWLVSEQGMAPESILALTVSEPAADGPTVSVPGPLTTIAVTLGVVVTLLLGVVPTAALGWASGLSFLG